ncbi:MAG: tRNA pseudouridine(38-40) synthase TruA [Phycisphaerae bacterium]|nr:tRNA pseudouridine(38-40) synthase TruA [Tepidisphaeraceae bacterium]
MPDVRRYKLTISYRGTAYHGWQKQAVNYLTWKGEEPDDGQGIPTIQGMVIGALREVVRHEVKLVGSSRTDSGVHAKGQVAHFDCERTQIPIEGLRRAVNSRLPEDILVKSIEVVPPTFDAISSTASKRYQYLIWNAEDRPVFAWDLGWHRWQNLDVGAMSAAAAHFVGTHDFASFAKPGHGRENTVRTVLACDVTKRGPQLVVGVHGTGFLWHMVRIMVGTLVEVGTGRFKPEDVPAMLGAKDRRSAGGTAPPRGLYLQWIKFREGASGDAGGSPD